MTKAADWRYKLTQLRDNKLFEWTVISVILLSSITVGARTYEVEPSWLGVIEILDWSITIFFLIELSVRIASEKRILDFFKKGWNWFDLIIVIASLMPLDNSEFAFLARLLRLFRVMRLISFVPQLRVLVDALLIAIPRMSYVALMMFVIFYIYAVIGSLLFSEINPFLWNDVGSTLLTLFRVSTFEDWTDIMYETMAVYPLSWIYYITFIFFSAYVFLNMMIGIIIKVLEEENNKIHEGIEKKILMELTQLREQISKLEKN